CYPSNMLKTPETARLLHPDRKKHLSANLRKFHERRHTPSHCRERRSRNARRREYEPSRPSRAARNEVMSRTPLRATGRLFGVTLLMFLYLFLQRIYGVVHRFLETSAACLGHQVVAGNLYPDNSHLVPLLVILVEFQHHIRTRRTFYETVELRHLCFHEFDELPVRIELNCLNLYVHN